MSTFIIQVKIKQNITVNYSEKNIFILSSQNYLNRFTMHVTRMNTSRKDQRNRGVFLLLFFLIENKQRIEIKKKIY